MKRKAEEDGLSAGLASKKPALDFDDFPNADTASLASFTPSSDDNDKCNDYNDDDDDDNNGDGSTVHPTTGTHTAPATTITTASRGSRKFPSDLKTIPCTFAGCPKTFNRPARLAAHLRSHTNDRAFRCTYPGCGKDYLEEKHLAQHIKGSHTHEKKYPCPDPDCGKSFVTATRLRRHAAVHEGADRFRCRGYDGCDQTFRKHQTLQRHVRVVHLEQAAYVCTHDSCAEGFDSHGALRRHVEREHGALRFWCDECNTPAPTNPSSDPPPPPQPRVGFTTLLLLQSHMRRAHMTCMFCDLPCGSQADVERHIDTHHAPKPLPPVQDRKTVSCPYPHCPKAFTRVSNLNTHIKAAHKGVRFVCGQVDTFSVSDIADWNWAEEGCGQAFISKVKLEDHVRFVHLGRPRPPRLYTVPAATTAGAAVAEMEGPANRNVPCAVGDCPAMFIRHADRERHVHKYHDRREPEAGEGAGVIDPQLLGSEEQPAPAWLLTPGAGGGGGGASQPLGTDSEWAEMRRLIDLDALVDGQVAMWVEE
jgi:general transcription factor IIIA